jgi:maltooligosyltrehalose trehalohydrolase
MGWDPDVVPDPQDPETFQRSKLDWDEPTSGPHARLLAAYRRLADLRRTHPDLTDPAFASTSCALDEESRVFRMRRGRLLVLVNFGDEPASVPVGDDAALLFATGEGVMVDQTQLVLPGHAGALVG